MELTFKLFEIDLEFFFVLWEVAEIPISSEGADFNQKRCLLIMYFQIMDNQKHEIGSLKDVMIAQRIPKAFFKI